MKFSQALKNFGEWRAFRVAPVTRYRNHIDLRVTCLALGDPEIEAITIEQILAHFTQREQLGWSRASVANIALALRKFFEYLNQKGIKTFDERLIPLPKKPFKIPRVANPEDFRALAEAAQVHAAGGSFSGLRNRALVHLVWDTWARIGELLSLNVADLRFSEDLSGYAMIRSEKAQSRRPMREIFWTAKTGEYLKAWITRRKTLAENIVLQDPDALFVGVRNSQGGDPGGRRMSTAMGGQIFRILSARANLNKVFNPHSARHYGARKIIQSGGATADVANILGHSSVESSYIYTMLWGEDLKRRWDRFQGESPDVRPKHDLVPDNPVPHEPTTTELLSLPNTYRNGDLPSWKHARPPF